VPPCSSRRLRSCRAVEHGQVGVVVGRRAVASRDRPQLCGAARLDPGIHGEKTPRWCQARPQTESAHGPLERSARPGVPVRVPGESKQDPAPEHGEQPQEGGGPMRSHGSILDHRRGGPPLVFPTPRTPAHRSPGRVRDGISHMLHACPHQLRPLQRGEGARRGSSRPEGWRAGRGRIRCHRCLSGNDTPRAFSGATEPNLLSEALVEDADRLSRFRREAKPLPAIEYSDLIIHPRETPRRREGGGKLKPAA